MKENQNILTALLIIITLSGLSYIRINKEVITEKEVDSSKITLENVIKEIIEIKKEEIIEIAEDSIKQSVIEETTYISQVVISGKITWPKNREARFLTRDTSITTRVDWGGRFNLTFPLDSSGYITFHHGDETTAMYCNPDDTVHITINTKIFDETITYTGSDESNFLAWKFLHVENVGYPNVKTILDTTELNQKLDSLINPMHLKMISLGFKNNFIESEEEEYIFIRNYFIQQYAKNQRMLEMIGKAAIDFTYPDMDSNMVSLSDFKGSYVYVDVWATWCGPCTYQIPFLLQLEEDYHDANIIFMSVSLDVENAKQKWIDMINDKNMGGVQLFANGWSQICKDYVINSIPRFMLFDPDGNIISVDAVRPSSDEIRETFDGFVLDQEVEDEMSGMTEADPPAGEE
jgi:thiol-disulfide isomerase/thioredoxin